jgi:hypothetical protein
MSIQQSANDFALRWLDLTLHVVRALGQAASATLYLVSECAPMGKVTDAIAVLQAKEASMSGDELRDLLVGLGFEVRQGSSGGGHYVVTHDGIDGFFSTSYDKSHNKHMLRCYPRQIKRVLKQYQDQLEIYVGDRDGQA